MPNTTNIDQLILFLNDLSDVNIMEVKPYRVGIPGLEYFHGFQLLNNLGFLTQIFLPAAHNNEFVINIVKEYSHVGDTPVIFTMEFNLHSVTAFQLNFTNTERLDYGWRIDNTYVYLYKQIRIEELTDSLPQGRKLEL